MILSAKSGLIALSAVSGFAMLYVGAYQIRAIEHMSCPLLKGGCEAVADAPFARPFGIPDGFIAAAMYGLLIGLAVLGPPTIWVRYVVRTLAALAVLANVLGVFDMARLGAYCFYCLVTTVLSPLLLWMALMCWSRMTVPERVITTEMTCLRCFL
jgi:uncharacterized membrane protein